MLKQNFLAANSVYASTEHKKSIIDEYFEKLNPIFSRIAECEQDRNIDDILDGPICHAGFKRLN